MVRLDKSTVNHEKKEQNSSSNSFMLKLTDTQNIIRNKFKKACSNRIKCEHDANHVIQSIATPIAGDAKSFEDDYSVPKISAKQCKQHQHSSDKIYSLQTIKSRKTETNDPDALCTRLRVLLASANVHDDTNHTEEINVIIEQLRNLKILV